MQTKLSTGKRFNFSVNFRPIVWCFLALLMGLITARRLYLGNGFYIATVVVIFLVIVLYSALKRKFLSLVLAVIFFFAGNGLYFLSYNSFMGREYSNAQIAGRVCELQGENAILENVTADGNKVGGVKLSFPKGVSVSIGDVVVYRGDLSHEDLFNLGWFNTSNYRDGVAYYSFASSDITISHGGMRFDERARAKIHEVLYANMLPKYAGVAYAVLTGEKGEVDSEVKIYFQSANIVHLLAVSGLHITFLTTIIAWILKKLKVNRFVNFILMFVILMLYAYICSFTPSVVRAMIMGLCLSISLIFSRRYDGPTALGTAGIITLLIFPLSAYDIGFLMSYGCVGGIYILTKPLTKLLAKFLPAKVAKALAVSLSAQIGVLPFLPYVSSSLNLLSPLCNLVVIPLFSLLFPLLIFLTIFVMIIPAAGPVLTVCQWGFVAILQTAIFFSSTRAYVPIKTMDPFYVTILYCCLFVVSYYLVMGMMSKYVAMCFLAILMAVEVMVSPMMIHRGTNVFVFGKGNGTLLLESRTGQTLCLNCQSDIEKLLDIERLDGVDFVIDPLQVPTSLSSSQEVEGLSGFAGCFSYEIDNGIYTFEFDGVKIFFTNLDATGYNNSRIEEKLALDHYDFVFAKNLNLSHDYGGYLVTNKVSQFSDYSLHVDGSLKYSLSLKKAWRLD